MAFPPCRAATVFVVTRDAELSLEANDDFLSAQQLAHTGAVDGQTILGTIVARQVVAINAVNSGCYSELGNVQYDPYASGYYDYFTGFVPEYRDGSGTYRGFFIFDLSGLTSSDAFVAAQFQVLTGTMWFLEGNETLQINEVSTPVDVLAAREQGRTDIFDDLGDGVLYASRDLSWNAWSVIGIDLNSDAVAAINSARGGDFAMGSSISTINYSADVQAMFAYTSDPNYTKQLVLSVAESDFYEVDVQAGNTLRIETSIPASGPGEFVNNLEAVVRVHDAAGNVVATNMDEATGELSSVLEYTVPVEAGGTYYIEVTANGTIGEYVLSVKQTTATVVNPVGDGEAEGDGARLASVSDAAYPWLNRAKPVDVSNDGYVTPKDALLIINSLNAGGARSLSAARSGDPTQPFYDVNGDGYLSPIDALQVINYLTSGTDGENVPETLPSGDPAVTVQTTTTPVATARPLESLRHVQTPRGMLSKVMVEPPAGSRFARMATTTDDVPSYVDVWENSDQDWVMEGLRPDINALADELAARREAYNEWRERLFSTYGRRRAGSGV